MMKGIRIALFALPFASGAALAQGSGTSGSAGAPGKPTPPVTSDTRTPTLEQAGRLDDTAPALPGDATRPIEGSGAARPSSGRALPRDEATPPPNDDSSQTRHQLDRDAGRDQLDSDK